MPLSLKERALAQLNESRTPLNRYHAWEKLGRDPSDEEALEHYCRHGGARDFAMREREKECQKSAQPQGQ